ncbi:DUF4177 domain-containing protein [Hymenobacter coalescens]
MRLLVICLLLGLGRFMPAAQQPIPRYQFMHVNFSGSRIFFSPARQGKEWVKVKDYLGQSFSMFDQEKLGWEAMSRLLNELSADGWELVQMLPENNKDGNVGAVYLLRKPQP